MSDPPGAPPPVNPYDVPEPQGMSSGGKVLLGLGIGCGVLLLLCCGGIGLGTFALVRVAQSSVIQDPKQIEDITDEIVAIAIPDSLEPTVGVNVNLPFIGPVMKGSIYTDDDKDTHLLLGQFNESFADRHSLENQLRMSMNNQHDEDLEIHDSDSLDTQINGEEAHFTIAQGVGRESKEEYWQVEGQFHGLGGPAILIFKSKSSEFSADDVRDLIKSMESAPAAVKEQPEAEGKAEDS